MGYSAWFQCVAGCEGRYEFDQVLYQCPMHPAITSDHPGDCPICGMKLVEVKLGAASAAAAAPAADAPVEGRATVTIDPATGRRTVYVNLEARVALLAAEDAEYRRIGKIAGSYEEAKQRLDAIREKKSEHLRISAELGFAAKEIADLTARAEKQRALIRALDADLQKRTGS